MNLDHTSAHMLARINFRRLSVVCERIHGTLGPVSDPIGLFPVAQSGAGMRTQAKPCSVFAFVYT